MYEYSMRTNGYRCVAEHTWETCTMLLNITVCEPLLESKNV